MKKVSKKLFAMYLGVTLLAAGSLFAASTDTIRATIPFDFMIGRQAFSAGDYSIREVTRPGALILRRADDGSARAFLANSARRTTLREETQLLFSRYGNRYFLREIWVAGEWSGHELPRSAAEKEAATMSHNALPDEVIVLAAR
jgi:hypothetical protein